MIANDGFHEMPLPLRSRAESKYDGPVTNMEKVEKYHMQIACRVELSMEHELIMANL